MNWVRTEERDPDTINHTDWGDQSIFLLLDYGIDSPERYIVGIFEKAETDDGVLYSHWIEPVDGDELAPPKRWCYIEE